MLIQLASSVKSDSSDVGIKCVCVRMCICGYVSYAYVRSWPVERSMSDAPFLLCSVLCSDWYRKAVFPVSPVGWFLARFDPWEIPERLWAEGREKPRCFPLSLFIWNHLPGGCVYSIATHEILSHYRYWAPCLKTNALRGITLDNSIFFFLSGIALLIAFPYPDKAVLLFYLSQCPFQIFTSLFWMLTPLITLWFMYQGEYFSV